jgi:3-oxoacyl-[acyl-carrier-protein] synthase III
MIVVGTTSPDVLWPSTACLVQTELGMPPVGSFDLYAAEAGGITALAVADRFVRAGSAPLVVIAAESDTALVEIPGANRRQRTRVAVAAVLTVAQNGGAVLSTAIGGPDGREGAVRECLERAGVSQPAVDLVIDGDGYAEAIAAAPLLALAEAAEAGRLQRGMTVLIESAGRGPGVAVACVRW